MKSRILRLARSAFLLALLTCAAFLLYDWLVPVDLAPRSAVQLVVDARGNPLRAFPDEDGEWRYPITLEQVSANYLQALLAYEDRWFYRHFGVNPLSLIRAAGQWLYHGRIVSGGSTLTMQVARIRYSQRDGLLGKLIQILQALQLEWHFSKQEILTYYLNHAPFGGTLQGVEAASLGYFGHSAAHLTQAQAALLAVLPQAPSRYRPDRFPELAERQRNKVLQRMVEFGEISAEAAADARLERVSASAPQLPPIAPLLAERLATQYPDEQLIATFIDRDTQQSLEALARDQTHLLPQNASLAMMVMEHGSGKVVAYLGSAQMTDRTRFGYIDMVRAPRSPGSTLKPFIYGLAIDHGLIHSESLLMDAPLGFGDYRPQNFTRGFSGAVSATEALQKSLNLPAVQVLERLDPGSFFARMQTAGAGLQLPPNAKPSLAIALGGVATRLENLVALFSALANDGYALAPRFVAQDPPRRSRLLSPGSAWVIRDMLAHRREEAGWHQGLALKTGTSYGNRDAWAIGVGKYHTIGVWVGRPDNAAMTGHYGSFTAEPILRAAASRLPRTGQRRAHGRPASVSRVTICWPEGQQTRQLCDQAREAWIVDDVIPATFMGTLGQTPLIPAPYLRLRVANDSGLRSALGCQLPAGEKLIPVWPAPLQHWLRQEWRNSERIPPLDPRCDRASGLLSEIPVQIIGLQDGARLKRHPTTDQQPLVQLNAVGGQPEWYWFLNGRLLETRGARLDLPMPLPGRYQLALTDQSGMSDMVEFIVEPEDPFR